MSAEIVLKPFAKALKKAFSSQTSALSARPSASRIASAYFELNRAHSMFLKPARGFHIFTQIKLASREACRTLSGASGPREFG
jgi:hypothetical protein